MYEVSQSRPSQERSFTLRVILGVAMLGAGLGFLALLFGAVYGRTPYFTQLSFDLGLGGAALASALSQIVTLVGGWLVWSGVRRR